MARHRYLIVVTSNFDNEHYAEKFVENLPPMFNESQAQLICSAINTVTQMQQDDSHPDFYKVVNENYRLNPGFEG